jgi:hypothetical protein
MLLIVYKNNEPLFRTVNRDNIRKVAKSIHSHFPEVNYPILEAIIWNGIQKDLKKLHLNWPYIIDQVKVDSNG